MPAYVWAKSLLRYQVEIPAKMHLKKITQSAITPEIVIFRLKLNQKVVVAHFRIITTQNRSEQPDISDSDTPQIGLMIL
jgi:hypothetical protein